MVQLDEAAIFNAARRIDLPNERDAYLRQACGDDQETYERVATMLRVFDSDRDFLESPPAEIGPLVESSSFAEPGTVIGRYKLLERIGEGGFAVVYMAEQTEAIRRQVALKIIKLGMDTRQVIARFEAERQTLAMMDHPGIAKVHDAGATETGRPYFVMELIRGVPITEYCDRNSVAVEARLRLFLDVCRAVQHAHQKGIIHRDIKPTNVLVALHDGRPVPKVIDFGIAKATHQRLTEKTLCTSYHQIIGTPQYMSPEQAEFSDLDIDTRSDIYSLGVLLYELLTGTTPFQASELQRMGYDEVCRTIRHREPPTPSRRLSSLGDAAGAVATNRQMDSGGLRKLLRGDLESIVMKALEIDRTRRYETVEALCRDIECYVAGEPIEAKKDVALYVLRKILRRYRVPVALGGALAVLVTSVAVIMSIMYHKQRRLTDAAVVLRQHTEAAKVKENEARLQAERSDAETRRLLYISDINAAGNAWENNDFGLFEYILTSLAEDSRIGRRDFAWRYLQNQYQIVADTPRLRILANGPVTFSPDGMLLVVTHLHGAVTLWRKTDAGWSEGDTFGENDPSRWYSSVVFSPKQTRDAMLAYPHKNTIRLVNTSSGEEVTFPEIHEGAVWDIAFSPDGQLLASAGGDGKIIIWDVNSRSVRRTLDGHVGVVRSVAFSPTEHLLASGGQDNTVRLWRYLKEDETPLELRRHTGAIWTVEFSRDGKYLASGSADNSVVIWNLKTQVGEALYGHGDEVRTITFSANQELMATASRDRTVKLWNLDSRDAIATLRGTSGYAAAFAPDGETLATTGTDRDVILWNVRQNSEAALLQLPGKAPLDFGAVHFLHGTANELVACSTSRAKADAGLSPGLGDVLLFWNTMSGSVRRFDLVEPISAMAVSVDGEMLATAQADGTIQLWEFDVTCVLKPIRRLSYPRRRDISTISFSTDGKFLIAGSPNGALCVWDVQASNVVFDKMDAHKGRINSIVCASENNLFASAGWDNQVKLWALSEDIPEQPIRSFVYTSHVMNLAFSHNGSLLAVGTYEGSPIVIHRVNSPDGEDAHLVGHQFDICGLAFSLNDETLFSAGTDGIIKLWDVETGRQRLVLDGHTSAFTCMALSHDEQTLATADRSGQVRLWRAPVDPTHN